MILPRTAVILLLLFIPSLISTDTPQAHSAVPAKEQIQINEQKKIVVDLSDKTLKFFDREKLIKEYVIGYGKPETPSPVGKGYLRSKGRMVFTKKGKIIQWSALKNGETVKIDYTKMLGFGIAMPGYDPLVYYIHSTTDPETVGEASSRGCIRMKIPDMLELYPLVEVGARIIIEE